MSAQGLGSRAIIGTFFERLAIATGQSWLARIAMRMDSDQAVETYKWLGMVPQLREWVGGRNAKGFRENGFDIRNKTFEGTLQVLVDEIRRDKTGQVMVRINELADRAASHDASLVTTLIDSNGLCYDGQNFFDTDHTEGENSTSQSNAITFDISDAATGGTPTVPTAATMSRAILAGVAQIMSFKDDQNEPMNELAKDFLVMAGPPLMGPVLGALASPVIESGQTNLLLAQKDFNLTPAINARLTGWTDKIAVFRGDGATKPFIVQIEEELTVSAQAEGSPEEFNNNRHLYGVKKIGNAGYGMWQHACRVTLQA